MPFAAAREPARPIHVRGGSARSANLRQTSCLMHNDRVSDDLPHLLSTIDPAELGIRIRQARLKVDLTQTQLAGEDASVGYVSRIEAGKRRPEFKLLEILATRLRTTAEALLTGAPDPTHLRIQVALDHAELALRGGESDRAAELLTEVRSDVDEVKEPELTRRWRLTSALTHEARGRLDDAIVQLEDILADEKVPTERTAVAIALSRCYRESGDLSRAIDTGQKCLDTLKELHLDASDDAIQLAVTIAAAHFTLGDVSHAVRLCRRAIDQAELTGTPSALAAAYWNASVMESERGATDAAVPLAQKAIQLLDVADSNRNLARLRSQMGIFQLRLDPPELDEAQKNLEAAALQFEWSSASPVDRGRNTVALARVKLLKGSPEEASAEAATVLNEARTTAPLLAVGALTVMGQSAIDQGDGKRAADYYREAVALLTSVGSDRAAAEAWFELGALLDEVGLNDEAHDAYRNAAASTGLVSLHGLQPRQRAKK